MIERVNIHPELNALLRLLDDPDERVATEVEKRILKYGESALAPLNAFPAASDANTFVALDDLYKERAARLTGVIAAERFLHELQPLTTASQTAGDDAHRDVNLESAVCALARFAYPFFDKAQLDEQLSSLARRLQIRLQHGMTHGEVMKTIIDFFVCEEYFTGNNGDYYNPDNSYINMVLETRKGIPISLSVVWLLVVRRLNLPFSGVNLPGHFLLKYEISTVDIYIDPYAGGKLLSRLDCIRFMSNAGYQFSERHLAPADNRQIFVRMLNNLFEIYSQRDGTFRSTVLKQAIDSLL